MVAAAVIGVQETKTKGEAGAEPKGIGSKKNWTSGFFENRGTSHFDKSEDNIAIEEELFFLKHIRCRYFNILKCFTRKKHYNKNTCFLAPWRFASIFWFLYCPGEHGTAVLLLGEEFLKISDLYGKLLFLTSLVQFYLQQHKYPLTAQHLKPFL